MKKLLLIVFSVFLSNFFNSGALAQTTLTAGDLAVIGYNTDPQISNAPRSFAVVALTDISASTNIYFTDFGISGGVFQNLPASTADGVFALNTNAITAGQVLVFTITANATGATVTVSPSSAGTVTLLTSPNASAWRSNATGVPFNQNGDQIIIFQNSFSNPTFIYGFNNSSFNINAQTNGWNTGGGTSPLYSEIPPGLSNGTSAMSVTNGSPYQRDWYYNGPVNGSKSTILNNIGSISNWVGSGSTTSAGTAYTFGNTNGTTPGSNFNLGAAATTPTVTTAATSSVTATVAVLGGNVTADGGAPVTERGVAYGTSSNPTISGTHTANGSGAGTFSQSITELNSGTTYHVRAYATNSAGTSYGSDVSFTTNSSDATLSALTLSSGTLTPSFTSGNSSYTASVANSVNGITVTPTVNESNATLTVNGTSVPSGSTSAPIQLAVGSNTISIIVTAEDGITTKTYTVAVTRVPVVPTVTTTAVSIYSATTAVLGGNVTADGGAPVTGRGVLYSSTNTTPTIGGAGVTQVANGAGTGTFSGTIGALSQNTTYYYSAYAINSAGTSYGTPITFITSAAPVTAAPVITTPANGSYTNNLTPTYTGVAPSSATVTVYVDGAPIGTVTSNTSGNWAKQQGASLINGSHTVYATAQSSGSSVSANSNTNTFIVDNIAPNVNSVVVPSSGTYRIGQNLNFTVNFSENVIVTGTPQIGLTIGQAAKQADYLSGSGTSALVFRYNVASGDLDADGVAIGSLTLNGGTIRDAIGNDASLSLNAIGSTSGVLVDGIAPIVTISSTAGSSGGTTSTSPIPFTVTFSESVTGFVQGDLTVNNGTISGFSGSGTTYAFNITPTASGATTVNVAAGVAQDAAGNNNAAATQYALTYSLPASTITFAALPAKIYGDADFAPGATSTNTGTAISYTSSNTAVATIVSNQIHIVGAGTSTITASQAASGNYAAAVDVQQTLTVNKATLTIKANNVNKSYGQILTGGSGSTAFTTTGLAYEETVGTVTIAYGPAGQAGAPVNTYPNQVLPSAATGGTFNPNNYNTIIYNSGSIIVTSAPSATITFNALPAKTYGDADFAPGATSTNTGTAISYTSSSTAVATIVSNQIHIVGAGTTTITANQAAGGSYGAAASKQQTLTVEKATATLTLASLNQTYDGAVKAATVVANPVGLSGVSITYDGSATAPTAAGSYAVVAGLNNNNYTAQNATGTLVIGAKAIAVTASAKSKTYGEADPALTYTVSPNLVTGDSFTGNLSRAAGENVGTYAINQGTLTAGTNYAITYNSANLTIGAKAIAVTAAAKSKTYGEADPALTYSVSPNLNTGDSFTGNLTRVSGENAGTYTINQGTLSAGNNYAVTYNGADLTISAKAITIIAAGKNKVYGDADPALTYTASPAVATGDSFTGNLTRVSGENAGTYAIKQGTLALNSNYAVTFTGADLSISARAIAVAATAKTKIYGEADPAFAYTITAGTLAGNDALTGALTRDAGETAGSYAIKQGSLSAGNNYTLTYTPANLTITQRAIYIVAAAKSKAYGETDPELTYSISSGSLVTGDTFSGSLTREAGEAAGTYAIRQGTVALNNNYVLTYTGANLTIGQALQNITFAGLPVKTYGDADFAAGATSSNTIMPVTYSSDNAAVATIVNGKIHIVGAGTTNITASQAGNANYVASQNVTRELTVSKANVTIAAAAKNKIYGEADPALTYSITSGSLKGSDVFTGALTRNAGENAGTYAIKQGTLALNSNYAVTFTSADLSISARAIAVAATAKTKIYGEADPVFAYAITAGTLAGNDALTGALTRDAGETAGSYAIKQGSLSAGNNYTLTYTPANLTITQRAIQIAAAAKSKAYGETDPELTYSISSGSLVTGDTFSGLLTREAGEAAGTYAIRQGTVALNNNYVLTFTGANLTIGQALQNITFAGLPVKTYGDADFAAGATSSNTVIPVTYSSDNAAVATIVNGKIHIVGAGTTNITASQAGNANYVASQNVTRELTVSKANVTIAAAAKNKIYGEADPALTYSITSGSLKGSDVFTGALTRNAGENAGTYAIKQGTLALNNNYNLTYAGADLSIDKKAITVAAAPKNKVYGQADPALTYSITVGTLVGADSFTGTLSRDAGENIGIYAIKQGTLSLNSNYTLAYNGAALEIGKKTITVTVDAKSKTYGEADPALTYTFSPALVTGDTFSGSLTRDAGENAGTYAIKQGGLALSSNYALTYTGGNLTIGRKDLVIKANDQNKRYGEANPPLTISYNGFVNGDDAGQLTAQPIARTTANQVSVSGVYDITVTGAASNNYNITYLKGTLTISKAQLTIAAVNQSKTYGEANPQLTVTYSGFLNGDTKANLSAQPVANTAATAQSGAGSYDIVVNGAVSNSYDIVYTKGTLTVNKAPLTITADNKTRNYGASNPAFTVGYSGFVNSDTQVSLSAQPVAGTVANATSGVGTYDITPSGAASNNYNIVYNKGVLTIAPASRSISFSRSLQATYGDADFIAGATLSSGETAVYSSDNNSVATIINGRIHIVGAGAANITASAPVNGNYTSAQPVTQQLTVNKARQSIDFASIPVLNRVTGKYDLSVVRASSGLPVSFTVADPFIVTLDGNTLKANRIGTTRVSASQQGNANYLAANTVVQTVEVNDADGGNEIVVRQAVSPNGDGINDFLYIEGIQEHPDNSVTVINRNGVKVFEIKGYDNRSRVFEGRSNVNNQMQQAGTYFFLLQYEGKRKTGWFVLKY